MKKHTKIYMDYFNYVLDDFIPCEICGTRANDIHHIENRGSGGSKSKDTIENLMALCRADHMYHGERKESLQMLKDIHRKKMGLE